MRFDRHLLAAACAAYVLTHADAAPRTVGAVVHTVPSADGADLTLSSGARVHVGFVTPDVVRVRMAPTGRFAPDVSYAIAGPPPASAATLTAGDATVELRSPTGTRVVIATKPDLAITVYDGAGRLVVADDPARPMTFNPDDGAVETSMRRDDYELYYGFGEKTMPLSRHQQAMAMWYEEVHY